MVDDHSYLGEGLERVFTPKLPIPRVLKLPTFFLDGSPGRGEVVPVSVEDAEASRWLGRLFEAGRGILVAFMVKREELNQVLIAKVELFGKGEDEERLISHRGARMVCRVVSWGFVKYWFVLDGVEEYREGDAEERYSGAPGRECGSVVELRESRVFRLRRGAQILPAGLFVPGRIRVSARTVYFGGISGVLDRLEGVEDGAELPWAEVRRVLAKKSRRLFFGGGGEEKKRKTTAKYMFFGEEKKRKTTTKYMFFGEEKRRVRSGYGCDRRGDVRVSDLSECVLVEKEEGEEAIVSAMDGFLEELDGPNGGHALLRAMGGALRWMHPAGDVRLWSGKMGDVDKITFRGRRCRRCREEVEGIGRPFRVHSSSYACFAAPGRTSDLILMHRDPGFTFPFASIPPFVSVQQADEFMHAIEGIVRTGRVIGQGLRRLVSFLPSAANTWFPGFAWCIFNCPHCHGHLGWVYVRIDRGYHQILPDRDLYYVGDDGTIQPFPPAPEENPYPQYPPIFVGLLANALHEPPIPF